MSDIDIFEYHEAFAVSDNFVFFQKVLLCCASPGNSKSWHAFFERKSIVPISACCKRIFSSTNNKLPKLQHISSVKATGLGTGY